MKHRRFLVFILVVTVIAVTASCKKTDTKGSQTPALENTKWLLSKEIQYYPNNKLEIVTRNSIWTLSANHKVKIFNPDSFLSEETGDWSRTTDNKIIINIAMDNWNYTRSYKILTALDNFMRLDVEGAAIQSGNGISTGIQYELHKL